MRNILLLSLGLLLALSACQSESERKRLTQAERQRLAREEQAALKVAVMPTLDCLPLFVAKEKRLFDTLQVDVRLKPFTAQMDVDTALAHGSVEGAVTDLVRAAYLRRGGVALTYALSTDTYWQLLGNKAARLKEVGQLGDKMVAMTRCSATDLLTVRALEGVKTQAQVFPVQVNDVSVRLQMLLGNEMDAAWLPEPQASVAWRNGHTVMKDSRDMGLSLGVVAFSEKRTAGKERQRQIDRFRKAYNMAVDSINRHGIAAYAEVVHRYCGVSQEAAAKLQPMKYRHCQPPKESDVAAADAFRRN